MMKLKMQAYKQSGPVSDTEATYRARSRDRSGGTRAGSSSRDRVERAYEKNRDPLYKGHRTRRRNDPGEKINMKKQSKMKRVECKFLCY